ncbi:hypothetical protein K443DRAFT_665047 [Laccaria amethystina LaAM-08-1]|uniref:Major facilitator superfamily (MFS) profile domain-containing protein n=1 Tax=Laccaria amethystina LaAM-08-1 TaxID=1095629 RepID=A0A0C9XG17_9AGAR|nr:hypothetical protein K443DRAFT_665047 [Laccaria amethystina LaAM-08-1]
MHMGTGSRPQFGGVNQPTSNLQNQLSTRGVPLSSSAYHVRSLPRCSFYSTLRLEFQAISLSRSFGPSRWLCIITLATGLCTCDFDGHSENIGSLLVVRSVLGFAEGGIFPGIIFYITL